MSCFWWSTFYVVAFWIIEFLILGIRVPSFKAATSLPPFLISIISFWKYHPPPPTVCPATFTVTSHRMPVWVHPPQLRVFRKASPVDAVIPPPNRLTMSNNYNIAVYENLTALREIYKYLPEIDLVTEMFLNFAGILPLIFVIFLFIKIKIFHFNLTILLIDLMASYLTRTLSRIIICIFVTFQMSKNETTGKIYFPTNKSVNSGRRPVRVPRKWANIKV